MTEPKLRLQEGLDKLKKLDPKTYRIFDISQGQVMRMSALKEELRSYILQGVIQDVIAAHSGWSIDFDGPHPWAINLWRCQISFGDFRTTWGGTPAETILAAYIAALEAEREAMTDG